jgi:hypothetical protein
MRQRNYNCSTCAQHIQQSNFGQTGGNDQAMICDMCQSEAIHVRCATAEVRRLISQTQIWLCERCCMMTIRELPCVCLECQVEFLNDQYERFNRGEI